MGLLVKTKLVMKDLGNPSRVKDMPAEKAYLLGTIYGIATGVFTKNNVQKVTPENPRGEPYSGLQGTFEGVPSDPERDTIRAGILYLPESHHNMIATQFRGENPPAQIKLAFEVVSIHATNAAGYSWGLQPIVDPVATDPLGEFKKQITDQRGTKQPPQGAKGGKK